jgi:hypothetical protein
MNATVVFCANETEKDAAVAFFGSDPTLTYTITVQGPYAFASANNLKGAAFNLLWGNPTAYVVVATI